MPLVSDAVTIEERQGEFVEVVKTFSVGDDPFFADFALGTEEATGLLNRAAGPVRFSMNMLGQKLSVSMDLDMKLSTLPMGTLLPMNVESINPLEADEETLDQLLSDLEALLMRVFGSVIPAPEAPSSVGGALLG